jgi:hypothetical protein
MDWILFLAGLFFLYIQVVGMHASGKNQESKGSPYWHGILMAIFIPYYAFYCWYKYRDSY